jgi:hypothetical protein
MDHSRIIDGLAERLGTQVALAERLGVDDTQVCKWKLRGIPARYWPRVLALANGPLFPLTLNDIESGSPLTTAKPARAA